MGEGVHPGQGQKSESDPCLSSKWGTQDLVPRETEARILGILIVSCKGLGSCLRDAKVLADHISEVLAVPLRHSSAQHASATLSPDPE